MNKIILVLFCFLTVYLGHSQVGINTTSPSAGSILDVDIADKGILIPRVDIANLSTIAPVTGGSTVSLLVYNTNSTTGPGFFYWDGSQWVGIDGEKDWKLAGNAGTTPGVGGGQDFLGTTDAQDLVIATNGSERFRVMSDGRIQATVNGSAAAPLFSWSGDTDKGFYSAGADQFGIVTNGIQRLNITNSELVANDPGNDVDFRVETSGNANALFIDGANDNIGIGTGTLNNSAQLTLGDSNRGILLNQVALTATTSASPISSPATGLLVYNTATSGSGATAVAPGHYYWNGSRWVAMDGTNGKDWSLTGNYGTNTTNNFLGSVDNVGVVFRTNNTERMEIEDDGQVNIGFGATTSTTDFQFEVQATATNGTAIAGYGSGTGYGIRAYNSASGAAFRSLTTNFIADLISQNTRVSDGTNLSAGIVSAANGESLNYYDTTGGSFNGTNFGGAGIAKSTTGTGIIGTGNARTSVVYDPSGSGIGGSGDVLGVFGYAGNGGVASANRGNAGARFDLDADNNVTTTTGSGATRASATLAGFNNVQPSGTSNSRDSYFGGYFSGGSQGSGTPAYAYVGMRYNTNSSGSSGTDYKIIGTGTVSTLINDENNVPRVMFAPEAPEIFFQDFGVGQLVNGEARINLDPILKRNIYVDKNHPIKVYVTLEGDCNGIYVTNKSSDGFTVKELQGGTSNAAFSWQIVANRADTKDASGNVISKNVGLRLPVGPGPLKSKPLKEIKQNELPSDTGSSAGPAN